MTEATIGDVIQINPDHDSVFGGSLAVVEAVKGWGVSLCYVMVPGQGDAYYRVPHGKYEVIGRAAWVHAPNEDENGKQDLERAFEERTLEQDSGDEA